MAKRRTGRDVHGILLFNKPVGISSNAALQRVKRLFQARKAGHTGSLDNLASGLLPICLGEATKLSGFLLEADKHYRATFTLGVTTTTGDAIGEILQTRPIDNIDRKRIDEVIQSFIGPLQQVPPMHSAIKHQGQALYKLARQGKVVERQARPVMIYALTVQSFVENGLSVEVDCSKGTYIRTLAEDIGEALGCGAHVSALHRFGVGDYRDMLDFETLEQHAEQGLEALDNLLAPMHTVLSHWPYVKLTAELTYYVQQGQAVQVPRAPTSGRVKLFADDDRFLGIGQVLDDGRIAPRRLVNL
ncbi:MAG: tRNA pseudouridine(55) synthase TruB [Candidatus Parabeggiatoa sp. nov. 2]|nr:MAG: tRNA pseudouridine(55) synthase TruB [Beggiatoa sp. 4572_84]RKZ62423.1 MAG: tRNA pseudouridine(55) synthase TruB [Gammaproteobacteria bacterium]HEC83914.1 tRNA pseudouridine(55) synthase TruB [Thioploca sp.]